MQDQQQKQQQQQHHDYCCVLETNLKDAASKPKSSSLVSYSPCSNKASPGSAASCACQERKTYMFWNLPTAWIFIVGANISMASSLSRILTVIILNFLIENEAALTRLMFHY